MGRGTIPHSPKCQWLVFTPQTHCIISLGEFLGQPGSFTSNLWVIPAACMAPRMAFLHCPLGSDPRLKQADSLEMKLLGARTCQTVFTELQPGHVMCRNGANAPYCLLCPALSLGPEEAQLGLTRPAESLGKRFPQLCLETVPAGLGLESGWPGSHSLPSLAAASLMQIDT